MTDKTIRQVVGDTFGRLTYKPVEHSQQELIDLLHLQRREDAVHLRSAKDNARVEEALWEGHLNDPKPMPWGNDVVGVTALIRMMAYRRPHKSKGERKFLKRWLLPLGFDQDEVGNLHADIGANPRVLWSCHTDTVHGGGGLQRVAIAKKTTLKLSKRETFSNCLGADDTAGVWLMREMFMAGVPGRYVFHRGEECGGIGSMHVAKTTTLLDGIDMAIALDRRGTSSVITYQGWGRCASDTFADSLADALGGNFRRDATGVFTDTANYTELVPECTNLSVGYEDEHHKSETLWLPHIVTLRDKLIALDTGKLIVARDPEKAEDARLNRYAAMDSKDWRWPSEYEKPDEYDRQPRCYDDMYELVRHYPDAAADFMNHVGLSAHDLEQYILECGIPLRK